MANPEQNPTKNGQKLHPTRRHAPAEVPASRARTPRTATRRQYLPRASRTSPTLTHVLHAPAVLRVLPRKP